MSDTPIRVGFVGLNAKESWAVRAHLPYYKDTSRYKITALLNSSKESAEAAIKAHDLPVDTKAYGSPAELAADKEVDMVVCSVRVDKHYPVLKPLLESGTFKYAHCEWPLGRNLAEAEELTALAKSRGIKTVIGLQGRKAAVASKVQTLIASGKIGKVLSVDVYGAGYNFGSEDLESLSYLSDVNSGGNMVTIHFSHTFDTITKTLGQLADYNCILETKRPVTLLRDQPHSYKPEENNHKPVNIVGSVPRTSHDQILIQGHFTSGALLSLHMRGGMPVPGTPALVWSIYGEDGELRITTPGVNLHFGGPGHELWHHDHKSNKYEKIDLPQDEYDHKQYPDSARNPARIYDAFADGRTDEYADWEEALTRHRLVDELYSRGKAGSQGIAEYAG